MKIVLRNMKMKTVYMETKIFFQKNYRFLLRELSEYYILLSS